jgi:hypothetical protein
VGPLDPFEQRPGIVQPDADSGMPLQHVDEWQIRTRVRALKNVVEISYRLMGVYEKNELKLGHRGPRGSVSE